MSEQLIFCSECEFIGLPVSAATCNGKSQQLVPWHFIIDTDYACSGSQAPGELS